MAVLLGCNAAHISTHPATFIDLIIIRIPESLRASGDVVWPSVSDADDYGHPVTEARKPCYVGAAQSILCQNQYIRSTLNYTNLTIIRLVLLLCAKKWLFIKIRRVNGSHTVFDFLYHSDHGIVQWRRNSGLCSSFADVTIQEIYFGFTSTFE